MRVIGGKLKGKLIHNPTDKTTRPLKDMVRESIFNILEHSKNEKIKFKDVKKALRIRNIKDKSRKNSPLLRHVDSIDIDTGKLTKSSMLIKMSKHVEEVIKNKYGK